MSQPARKLIFEYVVIVTCLDNLRQVGIKKFPTRAEAEAFMKTCSEYHPVLGRLDLRSLMIIEKEKPQHIQTLDNEDPLDYDPFATIYRKKVLKK